MNDDRRNFIAGGRFLRRRRMSRITRAVARPRSKVMGFASAQPILRAAGARASLGESTEWRKKARDQRHNGDDWLGHSGAPCRTLALNRRKPDSFLGQRFLPKINPLPFSEGDIYSTGGARSA